MHHLHLMPSARARTVALLLLAALLQLDAHRHSRGAPDASPPTPAAPQPRPARAADTPQPGRKHCTGRAAPARLERPEDTPAERSISRIQDLEEGRGRLEPRSVRTRGGPAVPRKYAAGGARCSPGRDGTSVNSSRSTRIYAKALDNRRCQRNYLYTPREVAALLKGGAQRLYVGNLKAGEHELIALFNGKGPNERSYRRAAAVKFEKGVGAKYPGAER